MKNNFALTKTHLWIHDEKLANLTFLYIISNDISL